MLGVSSPVRLAAAFFHHRYGLSIGAGGRFDNGAVVESTCFSSNLWLEGAEKGEIYLPGGKINA